MHPCPVGTTPTLRFACSCSAVGVTTTLVYGPAPVNALGGPASASAAASCDVAASCAAPASVPPPPPPPPPASSLAPESAPTEFWLPPPPVAGVCLVPNVTAPGS